MSQRETGTAERQPEDARRMLLPVKRDSSSEEEKFVFFRKFGGAPESVSGADATKVKASTCLASFRDVLARFFFFWPGET